MNFGVLLRDLIKESGPLHASGSDLSPKMFEFLRRSYGLGSTDYHNEDDVLLGNIERRDSGNLGEPLDEQDERSQGAKAQKRKRLTIGLQALRRAWTVRFSITAYLLTVVLFSLGQ